MKKALFLMLFMGSLFLANAQSAVGVTYQSQTYNDGDTITVVVPTTAESFDGIGLKNQSNSRLEGLVVTLTQLTIGSIEIYATCTGEVCVPGLVSNPIDIAIRGSYNSFILDFYNNYPDNTTPSVYTMNVANDNVSTTVVLKFCFAGVGINPVLANAQLSAFPNPAGKQVSITYHVDHPATLEVCDMQGRTVVSQPVSGTGTLSLNDLPAGLYAYGLSGGYKHKLVVR